jgi:hypothetical protein
MHQPLHTVKLFTTQFPAPEDDRGGTRFYIRVKPTNRTTISLHEFWDDLILGSDKFQSVRNKAIALRLRPQHVRTQLPELAETQFTQWAKTESFALAKAEGYRNGTLQGSRDKENGEVIPARLHRDGQAPCRAPHGARRVSPGRRAQAGVSLVRGVSSDERHHVIVVTGKIEGSSQQGLWRRGTLSYKRICMAKLRLGSVCNTSRDKNL